MKNSVQSRAQGFSLIEFLIYSAILGLGAVLLLKILTSATGVHNRQTAINEVNSQISFVSEAIQRLVQNSAVIDIPVGSPVNVLILRHSASSSDPVRVYSGNGYLYLEEGTAPAVALTSSKVKVDKFAAAKFEIPGGKSSVQIDLVLSANTNNPKSRFSRAIQPFFTRVSAATFDSDLVPNANNLLNFGIPGNAWRNGYFLGSVGIGTAIPGFKLQVDGTAGFRRNSAQDGDNFISLVNTETGGKTFTVGITSGANGSLVFRDGGLVDRLKIGAVAEIGGPSAPACLKLRDSDDGGWTYCTFLDGAINCSLMPC